MRKLLMLTVPFALLSAGAAWGGPLTYVFTVNTASISGSTGSLDFGLPLISQGPVRPYNPLLTFRVWAEF